MRVVGPADYDDDDDALSVGGVIQLVKYGNTLCIESSKREMNFIALLLPRTLCVFAELFTEQLQI